MTPKKGGTPLPPSPICLPREHAKAAAYVCAIEEALTRAGWSSGQRGRLRAQLRLWKYRAEGRDPQFERYGSFGRKPGTAPPTSVDATVEAWRRIAPQDAEGRKRRKVPWTSRDAARERARFRSQAWKRRQEGEVT